MNSKKASFSAQDIASMVEAAEWDNVHIGIEPPDNNGLESAEDSGDEDFGGKYLLFLLFE